MADSKSLSQIYPGRGLGWISLGASLHGIISRIKAQPQSYPQLDLSYSSQEPILEPLVLSLPANGIRLRFDGPDQRLRLIEIVDFSKTTFLYKNTELVRRPTGSDDTVPHDSSVPGPSFRHIYNRLFGPAYPGEYIPPENGSSTGTYVLSYPGLAIKFSLKHTAWSDKADFVSLLTAAASPAASVAIFSGSSWSEARQDLYVKESLLPRSISLANKNAENVPDEVERAVIHGRGKIELIRRSSLPFTILLSETTPQDIIAELGPPDAIFHKNESKLSIHTTNISSDPRHDYLDPALDPGFMGTDRSSSTRNFTTEDSESEVPNTNSDETDGITKEYFYNYFHHGFDVLIALPTTKSPSFPSDPTNQAEDGVSSLPPQSSTGSLVATKVFLHSNVPGSYSFNRHRRIRWTIATDNTSPTASRPHSEARFTEVSDYLKQVWQETYKDAEEESKLQRGMVLNRGWGESPESSIELLGGFDDEISDDGDVSRQQSRGGRRAGAGGNSVVAAGGAGSRPDSLSNLSNTQLFGFPGLLFEVLKNDLISCVTIY